MRKTIRNLDDVKERCEFNDRGCWIWLGGCQRSGRHGQVLYASFRWNGKTTRGNRAVWEMAHDKPSADLHVCHTCDEGRCVNPGHLFLGTRSENMQDKISKGRDHNQKKTHCPRGHEYAGKNLIDRKGRARSCRTCMREHLHQYDVRNREKRRVAALARYYAKKTEVKDGKQLG